jgi:adenylate cyclase
MAVMRLPRLPRAPVRLDRAAGWTLPLAVLVALVGVRLSGWSWVEAVQHRAFDAFLNISPRPYEDVEGLRVRVVDIDEETLRLHGQWPWPRVQVARLTERLVERGAAVVAWDAVFPEPDRTSPKNVAALWPAGEGFDEVKRRVSSLKDHDQILAETLKRTPTVLGFAPTGDPRQRPPEPKPASAVGFFGDLKVIGEADDGSPVYETGSDPTSFIDDYQGAACNLPLLEKAAPGLGSFGFTPEHDGIVRRVPLFFRFGERLYPGLAPEAIRVAEGQSGYKVRIGGTNKEGLLGRLMRGNTGITKVKVGGHVVPTDGKGHIWVYYTRDRGPRTLPAWKVLDPKAALAGLQGAIVFIGTSAQGLRDLRNTPLEAGVDGVQVHANIAEQILLGRYLERPGHADRVETVVTLLAGLLLLFLLQRLGAAWSAPVALLMVAGAVWTSWHAYKSWSWLLDPVFPVLTLAGVYGSFIAWGYIRSEQDRRRITDTFGRYLSPKVVHKLAENPGAVQLGGETREMTFHFCDIRGFTTISEKFDPHGLTVFINNFLTPMTETILEHDGTIDKYMGDCIMAFWNAPMDVPQHARQACRAALKMHARLKELNAKWQAEAQAAGKTLPLIEIGTGLNTGPCVVGNMGSSLRVDYTVLGDDVNLASRLEGQSKGYGVKIVIGPRTREQAPEFAAIELDLIKVKGKTEAVRIYALLGSADDAESTAFKELSSGWSGVLAAYRAQQWDEAEKKLKQLAPSAAAYGLGKLLHLYEERIAHFRAEPPGKDWDGVFVATSK